MGLGLGSEERPIDTVIRYGVLAAVLTLAAIIITLLLAFTPVPDVIAPVCLAGPALLLPVISLGGGGHSGFYVFRHLGLMFVIMIYAFALSAAAVGITS